MKKTATAAILLMLFSPVLSFAQLKEQAEPVDFSNVLTRGLTNPKSLFGMIGLDPDRLTIQQSYSLSYMSLGGHGFSQGMYLNTMGYKISDDMSVSMQWGIMNQPMGSFGVPSLYSNGLFFSGANFEYKPNDKFSVGIQFSKTPYNRYYDPYGRSYLYDSGFRSDHDWPSFDDEDK